MDEGKTDEEKTGQATGAIGVSSGQPLMALMNWNGGTPMKVIMVFTGNMVNRACAFFRSQSRAFLSSQSPRRSHIPPPRRPGLAWSSG